MGLGIAGIAGKGGNVGLGSVGMVGIVGNGGGVAGCVSSKWRAAKPVWLPNDIKMSTDEKKTAVEAMIVCIGGRTWEEKI